MNIEIKKYLESFDALLISSPANIIYLTGFSGFSETEREFLLIITKDSNFLITDRRYSEAVRKEVKDFIVIETGVGNFLKDGARELLKKLGIKTVGFEEDNLTVAEYSSWKKLTKLKPFSLTNLRSSKTNNEIENIKLACRIGDEAFTYILPKIKAGISEKEIANEIENFIKSKNAETSFKSIAAFGKNSSVPHHQTGDLKLKNNQIILLDFGVKINNYCSDMSRTIFFGSATAEFKRMHRVVLEAQTKAIEFLKSSIVNHKSINGGDVDKVARDYITKQKYPNIPHSVGHGIGIEVHETPHISPKSNDVIKENMIFSVEPGIYIPDFGGVRIEDLVLVRGGSAELISKANREIIEL